ncbi:hypothetical protein ACHAPO_008909 [Fusarium lateritium]
MKSTLNYAMATLATLASVTSVAAQNMSFGADNFYRSESVKLQPITFNTKYNNSIAGNLFLASNLSTTTSQPAIVVGHPMGATKEQSANLYAQKLAEQGFVTLTLDLPFFGLSDGLHNLVSLDMYTEAYSAAVDHLGTYEFVDRQRIGALGICGSGGYVINAAKIDTRIKAIATSSMYDMGAVNRDGLNNAQDLETRMEILANASMARWAAVDGEPEAISIGSPLELTEDTDAVSAEFYDFYRTYRGEYTAAGWMVNMTTHRTLATNIKFFNFYPFHNMEQIAPRPLLIVSGDISHSREFSVDAYRAASEPKELFWVPQASHTDLYDRTEIIPFDKFTQFFRHNLATGNSTN